MTRLLRVVLSLGALCAGLPSCNRPADDLREWRPTDHHHATEARPESAEGPAQVSGAAEPAVPGLDEVTIATFRRACVSCHGQLGRGDGPQGPMVKARDLSDPTWQASVTDAQIAEAITRGRGRMPPATLPPATVQNLVQLVRLLNRARGADPAPPAPAPGEGQGAPPAPGSSVERP